MPKHLHIQIPIPCHENWDNMTIEAKGRHCHSCKKTVIDFTNMTDSQIVGFLKNNKQDSCGHFYEDQLNKYIPIPKKEIPWLKYFFTFSIPAFLFSLKASAQKYLKNEKSLLVTEKNILPIQKISEQNILMSNVQQEKEEIKPTITLLPEVKVESNNYRGRRLGGFVSGYVVVTKSSSFTCKKSGLTINKVDDNASLKISIYPNPICVGNKLNIVWEKPINQNQLVEIFTVDGKLLQQQILPVNIKTNTSFIYLNVLVKNLCFLRITNMKTGEKISKEIIVN